MCNLKATYGIISFSEYNKYVRYLDHIFIENNYNIINSFTIGFDSESNLHQAVNYLWSKFCNTRSSIKYLFNIIVSTNEEYEEYFSKHYKFDLSDYNQGQISIFFTDTIISSLLTIKIQTLIAVDGDNHCINGSITYNNNKRIEGTENTILYFLGFHYFIACKTADDILSQNAQYMFNYNNIIWYIFDDINDIMDDINHITFVIHGGYFLYNAIDNILVGKCIDDVINIFNTLPQHERNMYISRPFIDIALPDGVFIETKVICDKMFHQFNIPDA